MKIKSSLINGILFFSLIYLTLSVPILITAFSQKWYENNYEDVQDKNLISKEEYDNAIGNLISYFSYREELQDIWSVEEKIHYSQVRNIFSVVFLLSIISIVLTITLGKKKSELIKKYSIYNVIILLFVSFLLMINFEYFWDVIFHPLLFNDLYWIMNPSQISYYLFPLSFFVRTAEFVILTCIIENILIYMFFIVKYKNKN